MANEILASSTTYLNFFAYSFGIFNYQTVRQSLYGEHGSVGIRANSQVS